MGSVTPFQKEMQPAKPEGALPSDPREQAVAEPIHVQALKGHVPDGTCAACGVACALHLDASGCFDIGCPGALIRASQGYLRASWPLHDLYGDAHPAVTRALQAVLMAGDCGPAVTMFYRSLGHDERLMLARELARTAVSAHLEELAR